MATQQPQFRIGGYELVRLLGRGGMGEVWLARDTRADRPVAIKFIKPGYLDDPAIRTRFLNEAKTLGRLEQDRIVTLYNVVEDGNNLALVLRFIDGTSLADRIDAQGALPLEFVAASARDILPALGFAHEHGIIHRDIKPQNVLVDKLGRSFLTDFGIAIGDFAERGTVTGFAVGTPHYMSPEQIQTPRLITVQDRGHRSDIYSYGVVLYEMLTGRVPFGGDSGVEEIYKVHHAHCVEPPPSLREVNPSVPPAVENLVLRCLAKKAHERPQSCAELLEQFNEALEGKARPVAHAATIGARAATILESPIGNRHAVKPLVPAERAAAAASAPSATVRKRGIPKGAWLGVGALLVASGISFAVFTSNQPQHVATINPQQAKTDPAPQPPPKITPPPTIPGPANKGLKLPPTLNKTGTSQIPESAPKTVPNGPTPDQLKAAAASKAANVFLLQRKYCEGKSKIDEAVNLDAQPAYINQQDRLGKACDAAQQFNEAKALYAQGQGGYCPAKAKMDEVMKLYPSDPDYPGFRTKTITACNLYGQ
jgi:eukaryotic-like serine/threonine-protein kinase